MKRGAAAITLKSEEPKFSEKTPVSSLRRKGVYAGMTDIIKACSDVQEAANTASKIIDVDNLKQTSASNTEQYDNKPSISLRSIKTVIEGFDKTQRECLMNLLKEIDIKIKEKDFKHKIKEFLANKINKDFILRVTLESIFGPGRLVKIPARLSVTNFSQRTVPTAIVANIPFPSMPFDGVEVYREISQQTMEKFIKVEILDLILENLDELSIVR